MKKLIVLAVLSFPLVCALLIRVAVADDRPASAPKSAPEAIDKNSCLTFNFRYLILSDERMSPTTRTIEVFTDEKAFNEENLRKLFRYLSDKNPDPDPETKRLNIFVYTDWKQLGFPSDCPPSAMSGGDSGRDAYDYHWARFYRKEGREFFVYNPVKKEWKDKDVIMKGTEIYRNGAWQKPE